LTVVPWYREGSALMNVLCAFEKNVYSADTGGIVYQCLLGQCGWQCCSRILYFLLIFYLFTLSILGQ
jgi:hypothetical protein